MTGVTKRRLSLLLLLAPVTLGILLVVAACGGGEEEEAGGETSVPRTTAAAPTYGIKMVPTIKFDKTELTVPAGKEVAITADNTDDGVSHNFAVYKDRDAAEAGDDPLAATDICSGPCSETATINLNAGEYFFRCDVHPSQMTGTLTAEGSSGY